MIFLEAKVFSFLGGLFYCGGLANSVGEMTDMGIPLMRRKARKAVSAGDYEAAALLYTQLMAHEEVAGDIDIKARHAFCVEKAGHSNQAIKLYREISAYYEGVGETSARESIDKMVLLLENEMKEKRAKAQHIKAEQDKASLAEEEVKSAALAKEKMRVEEEKRKAIQNEIDQIRAKKAEEERIHLEKIQQEQLLAEKARKKDLRKLKEAAERARQERYKGIKSKDSIVTEYDLDASLEQGDFDWTDMEDDGVIVLDLSDTEEAKKEKAHFTGVKKNDPTWL